MLGPGFCLSRLRSSLSPSGTPDAARPRVVRPQATVMALARLHAGVHRRRAAGLNAGGAKYAVPEHMNSLVKLRTG
ncbi:hypothetical protein COCOBI_02-8500 [Coccomyxa sp. Obi]|nr:hypothetical protein COCOBI_02-8500 [Coccomyxa sp. Obi]